MFLMQEATSNLAAAMSVFFRNCRVMLPVPFPDMEETDDMSSSPDRTPSIFEVTSASMTLSEASFQVYEIFIVRSCTDGVYWTLSIGIDTMPSSAATAMSSRTVNAGILFIRIPPFSGIFHSRAPARKTD